MLFPKKYVQHLLQKRKLEFKIHGHLVRLEHVAFMSFFLTAEVRSQSFHTVAGWMTGNDIYRHDMNDCSWLVEIMQYYVPQNLMLLDSYNIFDLNFWIGNISVGGAIRNMIWQFVTEAAATEREREREGG